MATSKTPTCTCEIPFTGMSAGCQACPKLSFIGGTEPRSMVKDSELYFLDGGMVLCGKHCGMSARFTYRDISGQKIKRVTKRDRETWSAQVGEEIECETCAVRK